jgi:hypothetical protein
MTMSASRDALLELHKRVVAERGRVAQELAALPAGGPLPMDAMRELAVLNGAAMGLAEEIELHTPKIGHGAET